eukprot:2632351-Amphidinium_carterae.2
MIGGVGTGGQQAFVCGDSKLLYLLDTSSAVRGVYLFGPIQACGVQRGLALNEVRKELATIQLKCASKRLRSALYLKEPPWRII